MEEELLDAINQGCIETIRTILSQNQLDVNSEYAAFLHEAVVCENNVEIVKLLLDEGANINKQSGGGYTPLHLAVLIKDCNLIKFLLRRGACINTKLKFNGWTPLHSAVEQYTSSNSSVIEILLAANADINAVDEDDQTPLHTLMEQSYESVEGVLKILRIFSDYKANFNAKNAYGQKPLDMLLTSAQYNYNNNDSLNFIKTFIIDCGVDVNSVYTPKNSYFRRGQTILHEACRQALVPVVKFLLENGANVNALDKDGVSPLQYAITRNWSYPEPILFEYLFESNCDINNITNDGSNILSHRRRDNYNDHELPDYVWRIVIEHLAKLHSVGHPLNTNTLETISDFDPYKRYFQECLEELRSLKCCKLNYTGVSLLNLLVDSKEKLAYYAQKRDFVEFLCENEIGERYPIYGVSIQKKFSKAVKNQ